MSETIKYKLPATFFEDHMARYFGEGVWENYDRDSEVWSKRQVTVLLNDDQMYCLLSDAQFYASGGGDFYPPSDYRGLINSAKATARSIEKQSGFDDEVTP
jgi:hypothetical protein